MPLNLKHYKLKGMVERARNYSLPFPMLLDDTLTTLEKINRLNYNVNALEDNVTDLTEVFNEDMEIMSAWVDTTETDIQNFKNATNDDIQDFKDTTLYEIDVWENDFNQDNQAWQNNIATNVIPSEVETALENFDDDGRIAALVVQEVGVLENNVRGRISILDYKDLVIGLGTPNEDWKDAMQQARDDVARTKSDLIFPSGIYQYSVSPNWNIDNVSILSEGVVRFRYTGTDNAVNIDAGAVTGLVWNLKFGEFLIECPPTAKHAVLVRGVHASEIRLKILGCGQGIDENGVHYAALRAEWCVCTDFYVKVTANHEGWYMDAKPYYGIFLDKKALQPVGQGGYMSWCAFYSPIVEHCEIGIHLERAQGCSFYSGTFEGCTDTGISVGASALYNKFYSCDLEANTNCDILIKGTENEFYSLDTTNKIKFEAYARSNVFNGGSHNEFEFLDTTYGNIIQNVKYNRFNNGATISDVGMRNTFLANRNVGLNKTENRTASSREITVGASPFTYTNNTGNDENIRISGGDIVTMLYTHGGFGESSNVIPLFTRLSPGDSIRITYNTAPTVRAYTT